LKYQGDLVSFTSKSFNSGFGKVILSLTDDSNEEKGKESVSLRVYFIFDPTFLNYFGKIPKL